MADHIKTEYKRLPCYAKMDRADQEEFDKLVQYYGSILNQGPDQTITVYTSHDFDRHCFDLYRIISMYLLQEKGIQQLNMGELYLLNLSVLLHDISMCRGGYEDNANTMFNRDIHALQSAQWIKHEFEQGNTPLSQCGLTAKQVEIICDICKAHSTLKGWETPTGLLNPELEFTKIGKTETIRVKALAGILRVADELDVTRDRLVDSNAMDRLLTADDSRPEVQMFSRENENSRKHFQRLLLITSLEECKDNITQLVLKLDMEQAEKRRLAGDMENLADDLDAIKNKIQSELDMLWDQVISKEAAGARQLIVVRKVVWTAEDERYINGLRPTDVPDSPVDIHSVKEEPSQTSDATKCTECEVSSIEENSSIDIELLDTDLSRVIRNYVMERHLLHVGHYRLNTTHCARDWIDTEWLMEDSRLAADIYGAFSDYILAAHRTEKFIIVGLDLLGAMVAAQVGVNLHKPFTYVIPAHQYAVADSHEVDIPVIPENHKVVLVTDSIVTGCTAADIIQKNKWEDRALAVYTVFWRRPKSPWEGEHAPFPCPIRTLNADFPAEIVPVSECPYGDISFCQAVNQKLK